MILITGATGHFGQATIQSLLTKGIPPSEITAFVRSTTKAENLHKLGITIKEGDYTNTSSLAEAMKGIDKLLLISSNDLNDRVGQHTNVINEAKKAGVKHIIYTSAFRKNETDTSPIAAIAGQHIESERLIKASGIPYTIMLNSLYADVLPMFMGDKVIESGIFLPAGEGKTSYTTRQDMAEAAANILVTTGHEGKEYVIANHDNISLDEVAATLSEISGQSVPYLNPSKEFYIETVTKAGLPPEYAGMFAGFSQAIEQGEFETSRTDLEQLLGRTPTSLKTYLTSVYQN